MLSRTNAAPNLAKDTFLSSKCALYSASVYMAFFWAGGGADVLRPLPRLEDLLCASQSHLRVTPFGHTCSLGFQSGAPENPRPAEGAGDAFVTKALHC